jgi:hypothetical protein
MTEAEWLACANPDKMLAILEGKMSVRKSLLFACACSRGIWKHCTDDRWRRTVETHERYADGEATIEDDLYATNVASITAKVAWGGAWEAAREAAIIAAKASVSGWDDALHAAAKQSQAAILRDIVGNPFRPMTLAATHRTPTVVSLARAAYDERHLPSGELDPPRLAVLADALEEGGAAAEFLARLRSPGPHVRGCFAVTRTDKLLLHQ